MLRIRIANETRDETVVAGEGTLLIGRAPEGEGERIVIEDLRVSRQQLRIEREPDGRVRLENLGKDVWLDDGTPLMRADARVLRLPLTLRVGHTTIELTGDGGSLLGTIAAPLSTTGEIPGASLAALGDAPSATVLARWFETLIAVQAAAASSDAFHAQTARAVVDLVGLDRGVVLRRDGEGWTVLASHSRDGMAEAPFSRTVLKEVLARRRTFFDSPAGRDVAVSLVSLECVVASPVFGPDGEVDGVVYGSRDLVRSHERGAISDLEAQVVQLLAGVVSAGLARLEQEAEAARLRVQFEQFFSPMLARELERDPHLLDATEREITVLFADVRGFSALSERLEARQVYEVVGDLLDRLTACVLDAGGVVVDYYGDGLEAIWNAPRDQDDHAERACRAALAMQAELPRLDEAWGHLVGKPLCVGVGLHRGRALVGNAGSKRRVKYGPRGHVVNLASRIEGATKALGVPMLVSAAVAGQVADKVALRRMGGTRLAGVEEVVDLFELRAWDAEESMAVAVHREALAHFEAGRFAEAVALAGRAAPLQAPALTLLGQAAARGEEAAGAAFDLSRRK